VDAFCDAFVPIVQGWFISQTDIGLWQLWSDAMERHDRVVFVDVPSIIEGMTVRKSGDGPSSWTIHNAISRPRGEPWSKSGCKPGGYWIKKEVMPIVGGKPIGLQDKLIRDYAKRGQMFLDPCCGGGTMGISAIRAEVNVIMGDQDLSHAMIAVNRCKKELAKYSGPPARFELDSPPPKMVQAGLFG